MNPKDNKEFGSNPIHSTGSTIPSSTGSLGSATGAAPARAKEHDTLLPNIDKSELNATNVVNKVSEVASNIAEKVSNNYDVVREKSGEYYQSVSNYSKSHPGYTILAGIGVGVLIGYMLTPRRTLNSDVRCLINDSLKLVLDRYL